MTDPGASVCFLKEYLPGPYAATLAVVTAFTVFIFKAAYFHPALLFYFLSFAAYILMSRNLMVPTWKSSILTGLAIGLAYLTKAAMLPALGLFIVFSLAKIGDSIYARWTNRSRLASPGEGDKRRMFRLLCVTLVVLSFLGTIYRFIVDNKEVFGRYFYNVSTRHILAQFLPFMFSVSYGIAKQPSIHISVPSTNLRFTLSNLMHLSVLLLLGFDTYFIVTERMVTMYGGR